jgi:hypothetical protein
VNKQLGRIKAKVELLKKIERAFEEAKAAGIQDPARFLRKILDARKKYKIFKPGKR